MKISGFQKNSLIDFPGTLACVIFTQGCNFICPYCHNPDLVARTPSGGSTLLAESDIISFLEKRKGLLDGVVITGGEPTLQPGLMPLCRKIKDMGFRLKLDSNGSRPEILGLLLEAHLLDYIAMDIKTRLDDYARVTPGKFNPAAILKSIGLVMEKAPAYEFRTTCIRPFIGKEILKDIGKMVKGASAYFLQKCSKNVNVLDPLFLKNDTRFFSETQMQELAMVLEPYVEKIQIR